MMPWIILSASALVALSAANVWAIIGISPTFVLGLAVIGIKTTAFTHCFTFVPWQLRQII